MWKYNIFKYQNESSKLKSEIVCGDKMIYIAKGILGKVGKKTSFTMAWAFQSTMN